jgi:hypothetical protein
MKPGNARVFGTVRLNETVATRGSQEGPPLSSVQLLRSGTFAHGWYGKLQVNGDLYAALVRNFKDRVRGVDIALDVEHQPEKGAAGWFRRLYTDNGGDELWGDVEWTAAGRELVEGNIFKYISIEYDLAYVDEEGVLHGPTMLGGALTNRPFIKNMREATIRWSEGDDADEPEEDTLPADGEPRERAVGLSERETALLSEVRRLGEETARLQAELRRERVERRLLDAKREGRVTPAMEGWLRELAEADFPRFERVLGTLPAVVRFGEFGSSAEGEHREAYADPTEALDAAVQERMRQLHEEVDVPGRAPTEITYGAALALVQRERPELVRAYRERARRV